MEAGHGVNVLTGGTDVHLALVDLRDSELDGQKAEDRLHEIGITVNRNAVPDDPRPPMVTSGLRVGTSALATRGLQAEDFEEVGAHPRRRPHAGLRGAARRPGRPGRRGGADRYPLYAHLGAPPPSVDARRAMRTPMVDDGLRGLLVAFVVATLLTPLAGRLATAVGRRRPAARPRARRPRSPRCSAAWRSSRRAALAGAPVPAALGPLRGDPRRARA